MNRIRKNKIMTIGYNYSTFAVGSITLLVLNLQNNSVEFDINFEPRLNINQSSSNNEMKYYEYILTSYPGVLNSRAMFLNGKYIEMVDNHTFPTFVGVEKDFGSTIEMPALSYGFLVVSHANASACL